MPQTQKHRSSSNKQSRSNTTRVSKHDTFEQTSNQVVQPKKDNITNEGSDDEPIDVTSYEDVYGTSADSLTNTTTMNDIDAVETESDTSKNQTVTNFKSRNETETDLINNESTDRSDVPYRDFSDDQFDTSDDEHAESDSEISIDEAPNLIVKKKEEDNTKKIMKAISSATSPRQINVSGKRSRVHPDGYLKIVIGCMFSGKTTYIIRECKKWRSIGKHVLIINYALDRRYSDDDKVVSHDRYSVDCVMVDKITPELTDKVAGYDVVLINEGQFFSDLNENVRKWCDDMKKIVVVSGLDGDYLRCKFGEILDLIPDCDELIKLKALCSMCKDGTEAPFTWKTRDNPTNTNTVVDIGTDKYVPLCRKHYNREKAKLVVKSNQVN